MSDAVAPLSSREALLFEEVAGQTVLATVQQLRSGTTAAGACVAALLIVGLRNADDVTVDDVHDTYPTFAALAEAGTDALTVLLGEGTP